MLDAGGATPTFYRRPLPAELIPFGSLEGRALFQEALAEGGMAGYFPLAEHYQTQGEPAWCGLSSLVVVLNALSIDPGRTWKGPWRWYSEEMLDCCQPLDVVRTRGVTLGELACLAHCHGLDVEVRPSTLVTEHAFREDLLRVARRPEGAHVIVNYSRRVLGQTGDGHFSPIGGYHAGRDLVLVLDVARFKYPPHWVPLPQLWEAMSADPPTDGPRGYLVLERDRGQN